VAANVGRCVATGVAGLSIEDQSTAPGRPLFPFALAVERIGAARAAIDADGSDTLLVGRTEVFLTDHAEPLKEAIARLAAFAAAGADCLFAPGVAREEDIAAIVTAVAPKPVNVLVRADMRVAALAALGVRRLSLGGALARMAWAGVMRAAREIAEEGRFASFADGAAGDALNTLFAADAAGRTP
jgi:2-methylisocitrate lyase-like PEP mutase family enzyme